MSGWFKPEERGWSCGDKAFLPIQNNGELAVLYCFVFLFIASQGGGIWSVDAAQKQR